MSVAKSPSNAELIFSSQNEVKRDGKKCAKSKKAKPLQEAAKQAGLTKADVKKPSQK